MPFVDGVATGEDIKPLLYTVEPAQLSDLVYCLVARNLGIFLQELSIDGNELDARFYNRGQYNHNFPFPYNHYHYTTNCLYLFQRYNPSNKPFADSYSKKLYDFLIKYSHLYFNDKNPSLLFALNQGRTKLNFPQVKLSNLIFGEREINLPNNNKSLDISYYYGEVNENWESLYGDLVWLDRDIRLYELYNYPAIENECIVTPITRSFLLRFESYPTTGQSFTLADHLLIGSLIINFNWSGWTEEEKDFVLNQIPEYYFYDYLDTFFQTLDELIIQAQPEVFNLKLLTEIKYQKQYNYEIENRAIVDDYSDDNYYKLNTTIETLPEEIINTIDCPDYLKDYGFIIYGNNNNWNNTYNFNLIDEGKYPKIINDGIEIKFLYFEYEEPQPYWFDWHHDDFYYQGALNLSTTLGKPIDQNNPNFGSQWWHHTNPTYRVLHSYDYLYPSSVDYHRFDDDTRTKDETFTHPPNKNYYGAYTLYQNWFGDGNLCRNLLGDLIIAQTITPHNTIFIGNLIKLKRTIYTDSNGEQKYSLNFDQIFKYQTNRLDIIYDALNKQGSFDNFAYDETILDTVQHLKSNDGNTFSYYLDSPSTQLPDLPESNISITDENLNQSPTSVKMGKPITLQEELSNQSFGRLLHNPFSKQTQIVGQIDASKLNSKIKQIRQKAVDKYVKFVAGEEVSILDLSVLFIPKEMRGFSGEVGLILGTNHLKALSNYNTVSSLSAFVGVSDLIYKDYEFKKHKIDFEYTPNEIKEVVFKDNNLEFDNLQQNQLVKIKGDVEIGSCKPPDEKSKGYSQYKPNKQELIQIDSAGIVGIASYLKALEQKLTAIHKDVCLAIDPPIDIPTLLPGDCLQPQPEEKKPKPKNTDIKVSGIVGDLVDDKIDELKDTLKNSALGWLLIQAGKIGGWKGVAASWFISYLAESIFQQQEEIGKVLCQSSETLEELKELISEIEAVSAVPDWYQTRIGAERPSLVLVYNEPDTNSFWSLTIPHYSGGEKKVDSLKSLTYTKGNFISIYTLNDNSKIILNTKTQKEGENFINALLNKNVIKKNYLKNADFKAGGERKGKKLKIAQVVPYAAKWFPNGIENNKPEWTYRFKDKQ